MAVNAVEIVACKQILYDRHRDMQIVMIAVVISVVGAIVSANQNSKRTNFCERFVLLQL